MKTTVERIQKYFHDYSKKYSNPWKEYDGFREDRGKTLPNWPDWCWCPLSGAYAIVSGGGNNRVSLENHKDIGIIGAFAAWRLTKGIYMFDSDLFKALWDTPLEEKLPFNILYHLPEWCVYIKAPENKYTWWDKPLFGWFVHLEYDPNDGRSELRFVFDTAAGLFIHMIHLNHDTLNECCQAALKESLRQSNLNSEVIKETLPNLNEIQKDIAEEITKKQSNYLAPIISVVLYLCSESADLADPKEKKLKPENPSPTKTKKGLKYFPPAQQTVWNVGYRIGAKLRMGSSSNQESGESDINRSSPRPHIRRAHWHSYWTGPKKDKQKIIVKWIPPVPVGATEEIIPTIRLIENKEE